MKRFFAKNDRKEEKRQKTIQALKTPRSLDKKCDSRSEKNS